MTANPETAMRRKMVLVEPKAPNLHIFSAYPLPRLGNLILGTLMKERGWDVEVIVEETRAIDYARLSSADMVGLSTITSTAPRAYAIADRIREAGIPVLMGGPHVTYLADEALEHADFVIRGEGEEALMLFIDAWEGDRDFSTVPGLSYHRDGGVRHNPVRPMSWDLDRIPFPDFDLMGRDVVKSGHWKIVPVQTSRGCPFDCSFCSVTGMFGKRYRFRSIDNIIRELRRYDEPRTVVFFYDDNFAANPKHTKELLRAMIKEKFKFVWTTQVRADVARDLELVKLMKKAGCFTLFIGLESINPASLKSMKKQQTVAEITKAVKILRRHRIHVHGMFVLGFDDDDWQTAMNTVKFAKRARLTSTQFLILTPLPGSEFYERIRRENRINFKDWTLYDAHHVVYQPVRFSLAELQKAQFVSHKKFYSWLQIARNFIAGKWTAFGLACYARRLNRLWKKKNKTFLRAVELLTPKPSAKITLDYKENIRL